MTEDTIKSIAEQLRQPHGTSGEEMGETMNKGNLKMNLGTIAALNLQPQQHILEIGMGNGFFVSEILSEHKDIIYKGCDFSPTMVNAAIRINQQYVNSGQAEFIEASAKDLPYADETFDKVFTVNTIYFWEDYAAVLNELKRVLKKNGTLVISLRPKSVMEQLPITRYGFRIFSAPDAEELLVENGLTIQDVIVTNDADLTFFGQTFPNEYFIVKAGK